MAIRPVMVFRQNKISLRSSQEASKASYFLQLALMEWENKARHAQASS